MSLESDSITAVKLVRMSQQLNIKVQAVPVQTPNVLDTGTVAWLQKASLKSTLSTACKVHRITWSYSSSITLPKQFALRKVYSNFGELKQFRRRNSAS
jgi:hypothetical protein